MKNTDKRGPWNKSDNNLDLDIARLKDSYDREAQMLMYGNATELDARKKRNRFLFEQFIFYAKVTALAIFALISVFLFTLIIDGNEKIRGNKKYDSNYNPLNAFNPYGKDPSDHSDSELSGSNKDF